MVKRAGARRLPPSAKEIACFEGESTAVMVEIQVRGGKPVNVNISMGTHAAALNYFRYHCRLEAPLWSKTSSLLRATSLVSPSLATGACLALRKAKWLVVFTLQLNAHHVLQSWVPEDSYVLDAVSEFTTIGLKKYLWFPSDDYLVSETLTDIFYHELQHKFMLDFRDWRYGLKYDVWRVAYRPTELMTRSLSSWLCSTTSAHPRQMMSHPAPSTLTSELGKW